MRVLSEVGEIFCWRRPHISLRPSSFGCHKACVAISNVRMNLKQPEAGSHQAQGHEPEEEENDQYTEQRSKREKS